MNRSTGMPRPCSWKDTKLTTYPSRGLGSGSPDGAIHSNERPQHLHGHVGWIPRIRWEDDRAAGHCAVENAATTVNLARSLSLSLALLPSSPRCSLILATARRQQKRMQAR